MLHVLSLFLCILSGQTVCEQTKNGRVLVYEDQFKRVPDNNERVICTEETVIEDGQQKITLQYNFTQSSYIENKQKNKVKTPAMPAPTYVPPKPSLREQLYDQFGEYLWNPFALCAVAGGAYLLYYVKSKFNLYTLGKACIEKAIWSLWKNKSNGNDLDEQDTDTALLIHIMHAYDTDNYTAAIARFLQDVEEETELLTAYLEEATNAQEGVLRFLFEDLSAQIKEAQERLSTLERLKAIVMRWLNPNKGVVALEEAFTF